MKSIFYFLSSLFFLTATQAQQLGWPKTVTLADNSQVKVYEPQPESYSGNMLKIRSAISYLESGKTEPIFGVLWADVTTSTSSQDVNWQSVAITNLKLPADNANNALDDIENQIQEQAGNWNVSISRTALDNKLKQATDESGQSQKLGTTPPVIIYSNKAAILVFVDGEPQIQQNQEWGVDQVVNTPFTILKSSDQQFYLYGNKRWYSASAIKGPWNTVSNLPSSLNKASEAIRQSDTSSTTGNTLSKIIVTQVPAELVQSEGEANFAPLQGTNLLYMTNSSNDVFMDVNSQRYYVLLSGRWYTAPTLSSNWNYTASDKLPADFAKIPESSPKSNVLANVAGTDAAFESVAEAQVPQTAKVDRKSATASVTYDGDPRFEDIEGTDLRYGVNSSGEVLQSGRTYYYVENGVWFQSQNANGPWSVSTQRPSGIENIPPGYPVYNLKYVHIYDVYPDYVYMGYTLGYLGNYVFGPTIVYGTGYYYKPWRGRHYYPRPVTWGFNMRYSPWIGWSFGYNNWGNSFFSFNIGFGRAYRNYPSYGGWWGPSVYRPSYYRSYPSYYGRTVGYNSYRYTSYSYNNVYRSRRDVVTSDRLYRPSVFDRRGNNGRNSYGYNRPGNNNNNGRNPSQPRPSGGYTNGRQGNDRIDNNGNRQPNNNGNGGNRQPGNNGNNGNNGGNRLPGNNGNNGVIRPGSANNNGNNRQPGNNNGSNIQPGNNNGNNGQPGNSNGNNGQPGNNNGSNRPGNIPDRQPNQGSNRPSDRLPGVERPQRSPERQAQAQPQPQRMPERQSQNQPQQPQPQRQQERQPQQPQQQQERQPQQPQQQQERQPQQPQPQRQPERQFPQSSREIPSPSSGASRPERIYAPSNNNQGRQPSNTGGGRQESRESRRRGG